MPQYSDTQRREAVDLFEKIGRAEASRQTGIPGRTIGSWAKRDGITAQASVQKTEAARLVLAASNAERREEIRSLLLDAQVRHLQQAIATDRARDAQSWMVSVGIGVDKFRLEMGEATGRTETVDLPAAEATIDQEVARLAKLLDAKTVVPPNDDA